MTRCDYVVRWTNNLSSDNEEAVATYELALDFVDRLKEDLPGRHHASIEVFSRMLTENRVYPLFSHRAQSDR